jgi:hypothetical protein
MAQSQGDAPETRTLPQRQSESGPSTQEEFARRIRLVAHEAAHPRSATRFRDVVSAFRNVLSKP